MVAQHTWPGCPHASHWDTPPIATQVFPALHDVPQHGCPAVPHCGHIVPTHPLEELPPLLPEPEPLPEEVPLPLLLPDEDAPLLAPSEPASGAGEELIPPPHPDSIRERRRPY